MAEAADFLRDGCEKLAANIRLLLTFAGEPMTRVRALKIIGSLPTSFDDLGDEAWKAKPFNQLMMRAQGHVLDTPDQDRFRELIEYFIRYIPSRSPAALNLLHSAFMGVLSVEFDRESPDDPAGRIS